MTARAPRPIWSDEDEDYVRENYADKSDEEIALHLGRSKSAVYQKGKVQMGIEKSEKYRRSLQPNWIGNWQIRVEGAHLYGYDNKPLPEWVGAVCTHRIKD